MSTNTKFILDYTDNLTSETLTDMYNQMNENDKLVVYTRTDKRRLQDVYLLLINEGFAHIVSLPQGKGKYCFRCIKVPKREKLLSIIVPLFNEEKTAPYLLDKLINRKWTMPVEFVIVESNSNDSTREIVKNLPDDARIIKVFEETPSGKGNAVLNGIKHSNGTHIAIQDGDLEYDVEDYDALLQPFIEDKSLFVLGYRSNKNGWHMRSFNGKKSWTADYLNIGQVVLTKLLNVTLGTKLKDPFTMYKIFHRDCMYGIQFIGGNFGLDWEIVIRFVRKGIIPIELPVSYNSRSYEEGKHISLIGTPLEGLRMLLHCKLASPVYDYVDEENV